MAFYDISKWPLSLPLSLSLSLSVLLSIHRLRFGSRTNAQSTRRLWSTARVDLKGSTSTPSPPLRPAHPECHRSGTFLWLPKEPPCILVDIWTLSVTGTLVITKTLCLGLKWCDREHLPYNMLAQLLGVLSVCLSIDAVERATAFKMWMQTHFCFFDVRRNASVWRL